MPVQFLGEKLCIHYLDFPSSLRVGNPKALLTNKYKPPVVLLHGLGANAYSWLFQFPALLQAGYRVIAPDFRGFGSSTFPKQSKLTIGYLAEDIVRLLDALRIPKAVVAGISLGGIVGLQLTLEHPDRINRLILINSAARVRPDHASVAIYYARRLILSAIRDNEQQANLVARNLFPQEAQTYLRTILVDQILSADPRAYRETIISVARLDVRNRLSEIQIPVMVITGMKDTTISPGNQAELFKRLPNAIEIKLPNAGHAASVEEPQTINTHMLEFIAD